MVSFGGFPKRFGRHWECFLEIGLGSLGSHLEIDLNFVKDSAGPSGAVGILFELSLTDKPASPRKRGSLPLSERSQVLRGGLSLTLFLTRGNCYSTTLLKIPRQTRCARQLQSLRPSRSLSGKVSRIGAVLEHVCQLLVIKVVDMEVIWEVSQGGLVT